MKCCSLPINRYFVSGFDTLSQSRAARVCTAPALNIHSCTTLISKSWFLYLIFWQICNMIHVHLYSLIFMQCVKKSLKKKTLI